MSTHGPIRRVAPITVSCFLCAFSPGLIEATPSPQAFPEYATMECAAKADLRPLASPEDLDKLLSPLYRYYSQREYPAQAVCELLASLHSMATGDPSVFPNPKAVPQALRLMTQADLTLVLDPTCGTCADLLDKLENISVLHDRIDFVFTPSDSQYAIASSLALLNIRTSSPARFKEAVTSFVRILPKNHDAFCELASEFIHGFNCKEALNSAATAGAIVRQDAKNISAVGLSPPVLIFRGRLIARAGWPTPFDPFRSTDHLSLILSLVNAADKQSRLKGYTQ